jgi:DNA-binding XRE family transcriptional regulator
VVRGALTWVTSPWIPASSFRWWKNPRMNGTEGKIVNFPSLGARIAERRRARVLSQAQFAERAGCAQPRVSAWTRGRREPSLLTVARLASALPVRTGWLLQGLVPA